MIIDLNKMDNNSEYDSDDEKNDKMDPDMFFEKNKENIKKLLCYNIVNNAKCMYKGKCMFAHNLNEQKKDPLREYIYNMIYNWDDLSYIDLYNDKLLFDDLNLYTKECKN